MPNTPYFNNFSLNDDNFIFERQVFKGYAEREVVRGKINRREGVKLLATEFGEKKIAIEGVVIASSPSALQTLLDNMKKAFTTEEGDLVLESGRTFKATVSDLVIPDEHYNQSMAPFEVTFVCSNPYSEGSLLTVVIPAPSGQFTISGSMTISGTMFARPTIVYTPGTPTSGVTNIDRIDTYHVPTGQTITVSGFGSGTKLSYASQVTVNFDSFVSLEAGSEIGNTGAFPRWDPGTNEFTITSSSGAFPGGSFAISYKPRYL